MSKKLTLAVSSHFHFGKVQVQVKPLSTGTSSSRSKNFFSQKYYNGPPQGVCQVLSL